MNERLRILRKEMGLTQEELGKKIGISNTAVSKLEKGENNLSEQTIVSICREFEINEDWLRTGNGQMLEQLTERQRLMKYTAMLLKDTDSVIANAIMSFIVTYEQLDDTSREVLNKVAAKYIENMKKSK